MQDKSQSADHSDDHDVRHPIRSKPIFTRKENGDRIWQLVEHEGHEPVVSFTCAHDDKYSNKKNKEEALCKFTVNKVALLENNAKMVREIVSEKVIPQMYAAFKNNIKDAFNTIVFYVANERSKPFLRTLKRGLEEVPDSSVEFRNAGKRMPHPSIALRFR